LFQLTATMSPTDSYKYELCVRQQPKQGRTSNQRDGRSIEPPPVLELVVRDSSGKRIRDLSDIEYHKFVANVLLIIPKKMITALSILNLLDGSKTVGCRKLFDPENQRYSLFFVFPDLFCRGKGEYLLNISLFDIMSVTLPNEKGRCITSVETNLFTIYSPKDYPGRLPISKISWSFLNQGIQIQSTKIKRHCFGEDFEALPSPTQGDALIENTNAEDSNDIVLKHAESGDTINSEIVLLNDTFETEKGLSRSRMSDETHVEID